MDRIYPTKSYKTSAEYLLARQICKALHEKGFLAYFAGGCVRDFLLDFEPNDFDVATSALPEQVQSLFSKTIDIAKKFGVIIVVEQGQQVEVTSFRSDLAYVNGRQPVGIVYSSPQEDARRRDFTMNAMFMDPETQEIFDYVGGRKDIQKKWIRTVGDAESRFEEDHLRILRAIRFQSQLDFKIEEKTKEAIEKLHPLLKKIAVERLREEMQKLLLGRAPAKALAYLVSSGAFGSLFGDFRLRRKYLTRLFAAENRELSLSWWIFLLSLEPRRPQGEEAPTEAGLHSSQKLSGVGLEDLNGILSRWKFPKSFLQRANRILTAWNHELHFSSDLERAEFVSCLLDSEVFQVWQHRNLFRTSASRAQLTQMENLSQIVKTFGYQMPKPVVQFADLPLELQQNKPKAGEVLKRCHLLQLVLNVNSSADFRKTLIAKGSL